MTNIKKWMAWLFILIASPGLFAGSAGEAEGAAGIVAGGPVKIATKPMVEQYILGEILSLIIEDGTDYQTEITKGIGGGTSNIHPAMEKGDFDLYPEYTATGYVMVLGHSAAGARDSEIWDTLAREYPERFGMNWIAHYGFNNTYCIAVRGEVAREYNLHTISDLAAVAGGLVFGSNPDYIERADGFGALCDTYGLKFKKVAEMDIGLRWTALESGDIDVTNGFTTDAQFAFLDTKVLEDDLSLQVNYFCSTVVRGDALERYPELAAMLEKMEGLISDKEMARLNYLVSIEQRDERDVAREFLIEKGIIRE